MASEHDFYLLGAGFSRAVGGDMPLLQELADAVLPALDVDRSMLTPFGGNFEQWMSHIAVDQPWLSDADNYRNRALFLEASVAVKDAVAAAEQAVLATPPPEWLIRLLMHWAANRDEVCTFNYDVLLERALTSLGLVRTWGDLYGISLAARTPPGTGRLLSADGPVSGAPSIYKLHGSTSWSYGGPHAPVSDRITLTLDRTGWSPDDPLAPAPLPRYQVQFDDLTPLIVPPTTTKGSFYGNLSLRGQWRRAFEALGAARSLTVIGYSFPAGDLQARQFLAQATAKQIPVTVVDPSPRAAPDVAELLGRSTVEMFTGSTAVEDFVAERCGSVLRWGTVYRPEGHVPVITLDRESKVPGGWQVQDDLPSLRPEPADAQRWLVTTLTSQWPERVHELHDPWTLEGDAVARLKMAYVPRA